MSAGLPERVEHPQFVLRCREASDAPLVQAAVDRNLDRLRRFMPWAWREPEPLEEKIARIREAREIWPTRAMRSTKDKLDGLRCGC